MYGALFATTRIERQSWIRDDQETTVVRCSPTRVFFNAQLNFGRKVEEELQRMISRADQIVEQEPSIRFHKNNAAPMHYRLRKPLVPFMHPACVV